MIADDIYGWVGWLGVWFVLVPSLAIGGLVLYWRVVDDVLKAIDIKILFMQWVFDQRKKKRLSPLDRVRKWWNREKEPEIWNGPPQPEVVEFDDEDLDCFDSDDMDCEWEGATPDADADAGEQARPSSHSGNRSA